MQLLRKPLLLALGIVPLIIFTQQASADGLKFSLSSGHGYHGHGYHHGYRVRPGFALSFSTGHHYNHYYTPRKYYGYRHYRHHASPYHYYGRGGYYRHGYRHSYHDGYHTGRHKHYRHHRKHWRGRW